MAHRYSIPTKEVAILILHTVHRSLRTADSEGEKRRPEMRLRFAGYVHRGVKIYILKADTCISPKRHVNPNIMPSSFAKKILSFLENG